MCRRTHTNTIVYGSTQRIMLVRKRWKTIIRLGTTIGEWKLPCWTTISTSTWACLCMFGSEIKDWFYWVINSSHASPKSSGRAARVRQRISFSHLQSASTAARSVATAKCGGWASERSCRQVFQQLSCASKNSMGNDTLHMNNEGYHSPWIHLSL